MSVDLVGLAFLMFLVTYPSRALGLLAPGSTACRSRVLDYLQLVGPAVLTAIAAVSVIVVTDATTASRTSRSASNGSPCWPAWAWCSGAGTCSSGSWSPSRSMVVARALGAARSILADSRSPVSRAGRRPRSRRGALGSRSAGHLDQRRGRTDVARTPRRGPRRPRRRRRCRSTYIRVRTTSASVKPASPSAASMIAKIAARLGRRVARVPRAAVGPGVGRAGDPARVADDDRAAVAVRRPPTGRRWRSDAGPASRAGSPGHDPANRGSSPATRGSRGRARSPGAAPARASSGARSSRPRGTPPALWSLPPIGPEPVERRDAHPRRGVRVGGAAGRRRPRSRTRGRAATAWACSTRRPLRSSFSIGRQPAIISSSIGRRPGPSARRRRSRTAASAASRSSAGRRPDVDLELAPLGDDVRTRARRG